MLFDFIVVTFCDAWCSLKLWQMVVLIGVDYVDSDSTTSLLSGSRLAVVRRQSERNEIVFPPCWASGPRKRLVCLPMCSSMETTEFSIWRLQPGISRESFLHSSLFISFLSLSSQSVIWIPFLNFIVQTLASSRQFFFTLIATEIVTGISTEMAG